MKNSWHTFEDRCVRQRLLVHAVHRQRELCDAIEHYSCSTDEEGIRILEVAVAELARTAVMLQLNSGRCDLRRVSAEWEPAEANSLNQAVSGLAVQGVDEQHEAA